MVIDTVQNGYLAAPIRLEQFRLSEGEVVRFRVTVNTTAGAKEIVEDVTEDFFPETEAQDTDLIILTHVDDTHITVTHDFAEDGAYVGEYPFSLNLVLEGGAEVLLSPYCDNTLRIHEGDDHDG